MYVMKSSQDGEFTHGELRNFDNIKLNPSSGVLNYGQVSNINLYSYINEVDLIDYHFFLYIYKTPVGADLAWGSNCSCLY